MRKNRLDLLIPAELTIRNAILEVEKLPADVQLTEAVVALEKAKNLVGDYIDKIIQHSFTKFSLGMGLQATEINSELELEVCVSSFNGLRNPIKVNKDLVPLRNHLSQLITEYEEKHWKEETKVSEEQMKESDWAERIVEELH